MGEFEIWLTWGVRVILALLIVDYLRTRLTMSEKYILKEDFRLEQERQTKEVANLVQMNREDHVRIEQRIESMTLEIMKLVKGINRLNGESN